MKRTSHAAVGVMPLLILALILSLLLILAQDGARLFSPKNTERMCAEILVENLDAAEADALLTETEFSLDESDPCPVLLVDAATPQPISQATEDGRILRLPSKSRFCTKITLEIPGHKAEDGFLAFGNRRLLPGARVRLIGTRVVAEGLLLAITPTES